MAAASVIVCTRNRAESCRATLAALLAAPAEDAELIVVDQSDGDDTLAALRTLSGFDDNVLYVRSRRRGLSAARNEGAHAAHGELLLYTDDDCIPEPGWVAAWRQSLTGAEKPGIGFGQVSCPPFDPTKGYVAGFNVREGDHGLELFGLGAGHVGMGANMALPKSIWSTVGGFDEGLGAGTRFAAGEDADMAYRVAKLGYRIRHRGAARVWHHGYRQGAVASHLMRGYVGGIAAMYAKHARCGDAKAAGLLLTELRHHAVDVTRRLMTRRRPLGLMGMLYFIGGVGSAWSSPLNAKRRLYYTKDVADAA